MSVVFGGSCPGGTCPSWQLSGWQLSWVTVFLGGSLPKMAVVRVAVVLDGDCLSWQLPGGSCPGSCSPTTTKSTLETRRQTRSLDKIFFKVLRRLPTLQPHARATPRRCLAGKASLHNWTSRRVVSLMSEMTGVERFLCIAFFRPCARHESYSSN